ncbi:DUF6463 family protein [Catelliglobosispora koreensis]|uniref:DUF6463 family protein n=1 Tax=Catelliglobosispora koreensis TaxID=129052 RepID=UPI000373E8AB|nr:DUF6463 family protein [Catelliglobosispora koreensis]
MKPIWVPRLLVAVACVHLAFGLFVLPSLFDGPNPLPGMLAFNSLNGDPVREAVAWFNIAGLAWLAQAHFIFWIVRQTGRMPYAVGAWLAGTAAPMLFFMPMSGFWFALALGIYALFVARKTEMAQNVAAPVALAVR